MKPNHDAELEIGVSFSNQNFLRRSQSNPIFDFGFGSCRVVRKALCSSKAQMPSVHITNCENHSENASIEAYKYNVEIQSKDRPRSIVFGKWYGDVLEAYA